MSKIMKISLYIILSLGILLILSKLLSIPKLNIKVNKNSYNNLDITKEQEVINIKSLQEKYNNKDIIAKIKINTILDTIVVKTTDNSYYLNHDLYKNSSIYGATFMDYRTNIKDKKILIYSHNFKNKTLDFAVLENYIDYNFYQENNIIELSFEKIKYTYQIFSIYLTKNDYEYFNLDIKDYQKHYNNLKNNSIYNTNISINKLDDILILQTCSTKKEDYFIIICAKKIDNRKE